MKNVITCLLFVLCLAGFAHSDEVVVTPKNPNGWTFGIQGSSKTAKWLLGFNKSAPNLGTGDWWSFTGEADGCPYAETAAFRGVPIASITRIGYDSYTPFGLGRTDVAIAPEMRLYLDVPGQKPGEVYLQYSPGNQGTVPQGRWASWNPLLGKWWSNKEGANTVLPLTEWVGMYREATINRLRIMTGTISSTPEGYRVFNNWVFGVDNVSFSYALTEIVTYNLESDPEPEKPKPGTVDSASIFNSYIVINPVTIYAPTYYIYNGEAVKQPEEKPIVKSDDTKPAVDPYKVSDGVYIPVLFKGNTTLKKVLSQLNFVGNPDETIVRGDIKITEGGAYLFGGVPFYIPKESNTWDSNVFEDADEHKLVVPAKLAGALEVRTIMGVTYATGAKETVFVEFRGSQGAFYRKELVTNQDIRDMRTSNFSKIQPPTQKVWSRPLMQLPKQGKDWEMFLDEQTIKLPAEFANQELTSITFVDKGAHNAQRSFLAGVTVKVKVLTLDK